ncbi:MAG TPA: signal recognition particle receptor subunit alpha, partial [Flexilinea sp.]|nr:signal recognition particle receptor subunit alpha [Flexilinea sp.]
MAEFLSKWMKGLDKTRKVTFSRLASVLGTNEIDEYLWDDLEAILIQADIGVETSNEIIESLKKTVLDQGLYKSSDLVAYLKNELIQRLPESRDPLDESEKIKPYVILMVGVNGSGKTTTTAKLAKKYTDAGKKVMIAAGDTYRAAAIEQLQVWGNRLNIPVIAGKEG